MPKHLCYLLDSMKVIETDNPKELEELHICTETQFDNIGGIIDSL